MEQTLNFSSRQPQRAEAQVRPAAQRYPFPLNAMADGYSDVNDIAEAQEQVLRVSLACPMPHKNVDECNFYDPQLCTPEHPQNLVAPHAGVAGSPPNQAAPLLQLAEIEQELQRLSLSAIEPKMRESLMSKLRQARPKPFRLPEP